jgi:hypothetical protein
LKEFTFSQEVLNDKIIAQIDYYFFKDKTLSNVQTPVSNSTP